MQILYFPWRPAPIHEVWQDFQVSLLKEAIKTCTFLMFPIDNVIELMTIKIVNFRRHGRTKTVKMV